MGLALVLSVSRHAIYVARRPLDRGDYPVTVRWQSRSRRRSTAVVRLLHTIPTRCRWCVEVDRLAAVDFTIAGLSNATSYGVFVRAINAAGPSPASSVVAGTPRTVPSAPAISTVALDTGAVSVSFVVGSNGGSAITNIEYSINGGSTWVTRSPASTLSPVTIDGLVGGMTYQVRLRVVNAAGFSAGSNISSVTAKGTPDAPLISVAGTDRALVVTFATPANGGTPITNYAYSVDGGDNWTLRSPVSTSSPIVISGLVNGTEYSVRRSRSQRCRKRSIVERRARCAAHRARRADSRLSIDRWRRWFA